MKLRIQPTFSESQKAQIVSRGEEIGSTYTFEMSRKYAAILPRVRRYSDAFRVSNGLIEVVVIDNLRIEEYRDADGVFVGPHDIKPDFCNAIASGTLQDGANCDQIMQNIAELSDARDAAIQEQKEQAERERPAREEQEARDAEQAEIEKAERDAEQAEQAEIKKAERAHAKGEKLDWINAHGSEKLRKGTAAGYNCQKQYVIERASRDIGAEYVLDREEAIKTKARSCPTLEALEEEETVAEIAEYTAKVVWLPDGFKDNDPEAYMGYDAPCEAVKARFLGYCLYKKID